MSLYDSFDDVVKSEYHNKSIRLQGIVVGKSIVPYHIPRKIKVECLDKKHVCNFKNPTEIEILPKDESVLQFIDVPTNQLPNKIKQVIGAKCKSMNVEVLSVQEVERAYISPPTGRERT